MAEVGSRGINIVCKDLRIIGKQKEKNQLVPSRYSAILFENKKTKN